MTSAITGQPEQGRIAIEVRERQIQSVGRAHRADRLPTIRPNGPSLCADLEGERVVSPAELRELAERAYEQPVVSVVGDRCRTRVGRWDFGKAAEVDDVADGLGDAAGLQ